MVTHPPTGAVPAALPPNEDERLAVLRSLCIMDTPSEPAFDQLTAMAVKIFSVPIALISLVDKDRQFFKSVQGTPIRETPRDLSFCAHSLLTDGETVIPDARLDPRFATNPFVVEEPYVRFYASSPILTPNGIHLGSFCIIDSEPRTLNERETELLRHLASAVSYLIDQRTTALQLEHAKQQIDLASERYRLATSATSDGIWDWDLRSGQIYLSARCSALLGYGGQERITSLRGCYRHIHRGDRKRIHEEIAHALHGQQNFSCEFRYLHGDGEWRWVECSGLLLTGSSGEPQRMVGALSDRNRIRATDSLTHLHNRASFIDRIQSRIDKSSSEDETYAVIYVDIDHFKRINDSLGHAEGDIVLLEIAARIRKSLADRPHSCAARLSSDEFAILLAHSPGEEDIAAYVQRLQEVLQAPVLSREQTLFLSASIGIATADALVRDAQSMLENADLAMYHAKNSGRSAHVAFAPHMREDAAKRVQLELDLRRALERDEILLYYQPKVALRSGQVIGFEALVRWKHPDGQMISPAEFIPVAEETGLIRELGMVTLRQAIRQAEQWRKDGILTDEMNVAVNISGRQIGDKGLVGFIRDQLQESGLPPQSLRLEVTESLLINSDTTTGEFFREIKELGIGIDMDDFGTGYSSLSYLHRFPFDALKVDRSFVQRIDQTEESLSLPRSIVALGKALGMRVLAEGIENMEQLTQLIRIECGYGQGYLFSKPVPAEEVPEMMRHLDSKMRTELMAS